jgi:hypothetical protein
MAGFILGRDPITQKPVTRNAVNLIKAVMGLWPAGTLVFDALQSHGIIEKVGGWLEQQLGTLVGIIGGIRAALDQFIKTLGPSDVLNLSGAWGARRDLHRTDRSTSQFVKGLVTGVLSFIRDAILMRSRSLLKARAATTSSGGARPGSVTRQPVPQDAATDRWLHEADREEGMEQPAEIGRQPRALLVRTAMAGIKVFVAEIPPTFIAAFESLGSSTDPRATRVREDCRRVRQLHRQVPVGRRHVWRLLRSSSGHVGGAGCIKKTGAALRHPRNPMPFVGNLVRPKRGFEGFRSSGTI